MIKIKLENKTIVNAIVALFVVYLLFSDNDLDSYILIIMWAIYMIYNLIIKIKYRYGKVDYILIPTINDQFYRYTSLAIGGIIIMLSIAGLFFNRSSYYLIFVGIGFGTLMFFNGVLDLPGCKLEINKTTLKLTGMAKQIELAMLNNIQIENESILVKYNNDQIFQAANLAIDEKTSYLIERYIKDKKIPLVLNHSVQ